MKELSKKQVPAREGWFTMDGDEPRLLGRECVACRTCVFPDLGAPLCPNPACTGKDFTVKELSRTGRIWSYTNAGYPPPPPFKAETPFEPFAIAAVELEAEKLVVLGQVASGFGVADLKVGQEVELVVEALYEDEAHRYMVWKWRPLEANSA